MVMQRIGSVAALIVLAICAIALVSNAFNLLVLSGLICCSIFVLSTYGMKNNANDSAEDTNSN